MNDAELMTSEADVPGLEVEQLDERLWQVKLNGNHIGAISGSRTGLFFACSYPNTESDFPTRNEAVQWILDQHKGGQS